MILAPGCLTIAAGSADDVSAYCLDQARAAPPSGALLADSSTALGETAIKLSGGRVLGLADALAQHLIQIEGLGNQSQLRVRNLSAEPIELCVKGPTIVMGNGETYVGDVAKIRDRVEKLVAQGTIQSPGAAAAPNGATGSDAHVQAQEKIWEEVNRIDRQENDDLSRAILLGPVFPFDRPPLVLPGRSKCAADTGRSELCFE